MSVPSIQQGFNSGEISPELYGQVSLAKYSTAATTLRNLFANYRGGATSRGGLAFVGRCKQDPDDSGPPRIIPFQFSITQGYVLEFGDNYLRFVFQGGYVLEPPISILNATQTNPCRIGVSGAPFANGDWVFIAGVFGMTQLNGEAYIVAGVSGSTFTLEDLNGNPLDATAYGAYISGGTVSRLYTVTTPYLAVDLPYLKFAQSADVMSLTCSNPITGTEYPPYELTRLAGASWTLVPCNFDPVIAPPATVSASANQQAPTSGINATFGYQVTVVDKKGNESIASQVATCHGADLEVEGGTNTVTWSGVTNGFTYNIYRAPPAVDTSTAQPIPAGSIYGLVGASFGTQFLDNQSTADLAQTPPTHQNPFAPGQILAVNITSGGAGLTAVIYTITTSTGSNFVGYAVLTGQSLGAFVIVDPGKNYQPGDSIAFNGAGVASGAILFGSTNPSANDTITLNSLVWTFVTIRTGTHQTVIAGSLAGTLTALVADLSASPNPSLTVASYGQNSGNNNLLITYNTPGPAGNAYTLAASAASPSGATLTGGTGSSGAQASGTQTFTVNPTNGQTLGYDGVTWTFVTGASSGTQTTIGGTVAATLASLVANLNASVNPTIALCTYALTGLVLTITYNTVGTVGNGFTISGGSYGAAVSAPHLTGGADGPVQPTATLDIGPTSGTYPAVVTYFQQRRFFANSFNNPDTFWASQIGLYSNFDTSIPEIATNAITASPWTEQVNGIQWLIPMPGGLIAMTGQRAWQIMGQGSYQLNVSPVTPATTQAQPQAFNGCSPTIQPIVIDYDVLYVQATGDTTVRDLAWNFWVNIYTGNDLTILSSHLFLYHQIVQWAWTREPYKVVWAAREDGTMLSLTYLKEQEVYGWARHDTQGLVVGVASVSEPPVDALYAVVTRFTPAQPGGIYCMERMDNRIWQSVEDAYAVDSAVSNPMTFPQCSLIGNNLGGNSVAFSAIVPSGGPATVFVPSNVGDVIRMSGGIAIINGYTNARAVTATWVLQGSNSAMGKPYATAGQWSISSTVTSLRAPHLAGMMVSGLGDGVPFAGIVVEADGTIPLPFTASNVKAGLPFAAQVQTPYLNGAEPTIQGRRKIIPAATIRVAGSGTGFQTGTNQPDGAAQNPPNIGSIWTNLAAADTTQPTGGQFPAPTYVSPVGHQLVTQLWTGDLRIVGAGAAWNSKGQVAVQQLLPLALEVIAVIPESLEGDTPEIGYAPQQQGQQGGRQPARGPGKWQL